MISTPERENFERGRLPVAPRHRTAPVALLAVLSAAGLMGCTHDHGGSNETSVTGTCALGQKQYAALSPLSVDQLESLLGKGTYRAEGNLRPGAAGVPDAGSCTYSREGKTGGLVEIGVNRKTDSFRSYDETRAGAADPRARPIDGVDGYIIPDPGDGDHGPLAVVFGAGRQVIWLHVLMPGKDAPGDERIASAARAASKVLGRPMRKA